MIFLYLLLNIFIFITKTCNGIMLCEVQGTCLKCPDGQISHFICRNNEDCFRGEFCFSKRGFCCPENILKENNNFKNKCPDGSRFGRICKINVDCLFNDEICIEGKCCPSCRQKRLLALREIRSIGIGGNDDLIEEEYIPQCNDDGKALNKDIKEIEKTENNCTDPLREFRNCTCPISCFSKNNMPQCSQEQCMKGCFCRLPYVLLDFSKPFNSPCVLPAECPLLPFTSDLNKWNNGGFFPSFSTENKQLNNKINYFQQNKCKDNLKNFQNCGSACPAGCGKLLPSNLDDDSCYSNCVSGCFCRIPYVLRDPNDLNSECILPRLCPLQPLALLIPQQISTNNFSFKEEISQTNSTQLLVKRDGENKRENCENDTRKEFLKCGSSCPLGCDQLNRPFRHCSPCSSGCFCKNGYIFVNSSEWEISECVLPSECPKQQKEIEKQLSNKTLTAIQKTEEKDFFHLDNCGEALAIAKLYTKEGQRIGRLIVKPERNEFGMNTKKIRLNGEFSSSLPGISDSFLFLSIHQYSDTTINGCESVGEPLGLNLKENNEKEIIIGELPISQKRENKNNLFILNKLIEWNDTISYGTNPLIGHSVVLQKHKGLLINILGCAVLGIAPNNC
uniref:TIL domain-containing protein n=1 Tax=Meloidogyne hapla TaxID=6305 RepID=A0A1I8C148_MELHA